MEFTYHLDGTISWVIGTHFIRKVDVGYLSSALLVDPIDGEKSMGLEVENGKA